MGQFSPRIVMFYFTRYLVFYKINGYKSNHLLVINLVTYKASHLVSDMDRFTDH